MTPRQLAKRWLARSFGPSIGLLAAAELFLTDGRHGQGFWASSGAILILGLVCFMSTFVPRKTLRKVLGATSQEQEISAVEYLRGVGIALVASAALRIIPPLFAQVPDSRPFRIFLVALLLFLGWAAHIFKRTFQLWYGITEVGIAVAVIFFQGLKIGTFGEAVPKWDALAAAVYFLARGLNNCYEGRQRVLAFGKTAQTHKEDSSPQVMSRNDENETLTATDS